MTLPVVKATFSKTLSVPPTGYAGEMSQPHWIPTWNAGKGCFIFGDESILYAMDRDQTLLWQLRAKLAFSDYALDGKTIYMVDGHVLLSFNADALQTDFARVPNAETAAVELQPQFALNLVTKQRYSVSPSEGTLVDIYDLADPADRSNAAALADARRLWSWLKLLEEVLEERRKTQISLVALEGADADSEKFDQLDARDLNLAKLIDEIRWLLGVDTRHKDRSCHDLITNIQKKISDAESTAANLRFTAPAICRNRDPNEVCIFIMDANGGCRGLTKSFTNNGLIFDSFSLDAPAAMKMVPVDMPDGCPMAVAYLQSVNVDWITCSSNGIIYSLRGVTWENLPSPKEWNELLALKRTRIPWARTNLTDTTPTFTVYNASNPGARNLLFVSNDPQTDTSAVQLVASLTEFPPVDGSNDFAQPVKLLGGTLSSQNGGASGAVIAPVGLLFESDTAFVYALTLSSPRPAQILDLVDNISVSSAWKTFLGTGAEQREKVRKGVTAGQIPRPLYTYRTIDWHKIGMQAEITTENWSVAWNASRILLVPFYTNRSERDACQTKADAYYAQIFSDKGKNTADAFLAICNLFKGGDLEEKDKSMLKSIASACNMSLEAMWVAVVNFRTLTVTKERYTVALPGATEALERATAAYSRSQLWNAWKEVGQQILDGVWPNPPSQPYP